MAKPHGKDISTAASGVKLEHRHFAFIAAVLLQAKPPTNIGPAAPYLWDQWRDTVKTFVAECKRTNPKFNRDRFEAACGLE